MQPWKTLLADLKLNHKERQAVDRFLKKPHSMGFLPVVEALKGQGLAEEAFELLNWGVAKHPRYMAARILLAQELYMRGLVLDAWHLLQESHIPFRENVLAHRLLFKTAILCGFESSAKKTLEFMQRWQMLDQEMTVLAQAFRLEGLDRVHSLLLEDFQKRGIKPLLPGQALAKLSKVNVSGYDEEQAQGAAQLADLGEEFFKDPQLSGFHALPLEEVFSMSECPDLYQTTQGGEELASTTLAEIYHKQGHYKQALDIYRRLLKLAPHSDYFRRQIVDIAGKLQAQRQKEMGLNPDWLEGAVADEVRANQKAAFYREMLGKLENYHGTTEARPSEGG